MKSHRSAQDVPIAVKRRMSGRQRVALNLPARLGRKDATIIDASPGSARVRHAGTIAVGTQLPLMFTSGHGAFTGAAEVASCRVVGTLADGSTEFESLVRFANLSPEAQEMLAKVISDDGM